MNKVKWMIPNMLEKYNLIINQDKTEMYKISRKSDEEWKKCKYLGSTLGTEEDINRRKSLLLDAFKTMENILRSKKISAKIRICVFKTYLECVFLYSSQLWTLTCTLEKQIDSFQRKQLRKVLGIFWPKIIKTKDLYEHTNQEPWSRTIKRRRLIWLGHVQRLDPSTPARKALKHFVVPAQRPAV